MLQLQSMCIVSIFNFALLIGHSLKSNNYILEFLIIIVPPPTEVIITTISTAIRIGSSVVLVCSAASLTDVEITWEYPAGVMLTTTLNYHDGKNQYSSSINIDPVTTAHDGVYTCTVENEGGFSNATISINVFGKLSFMK